MPHATGGRHSQPNPGDSSRTRKTFSASCESPPPVDLIISQHPRSLTGTRPLCPSRRSPHLLSPCSLSALSSSSRPVSHEHKSITGITNNRHRRPHLYSAQRQFVSLQSLLHYFRYGLRRAAAALLSCCSASMADEPRQRRSLPHRTSQDVVPEPEPAHVRPDADADTASDNECEATELRTVTPGQSARRRSRVLSPPFSSKAHWYDPVSKYWRHNVNITVPHDDCRDHLGKASFCIGIVHTAGGTHGASLRT